MPLFPFGTPQDDSADSLLLQQQSRIRTYTEPLAPPPTLERDPFVVPVFAWNSVLAEDIKRRAGMIAVRQDSQDIAFNFAVEGAREQALAGLNPITGIGGARGQPRDPLLRQHPGLTQGQELQLAAAQQLFDGAIARVRRAERPDDPTAPWENTGAP